MNANTKQPENPTCKHWKDTPHGAITCVNPYDGKCCECGKQVKPNPNRDDMVDAMRYAFMASKQKKLTLWQKIVAWFKKLWRRPNDY